MTELSTTMAKLSGIQKAVESVMNENVSRARGRGEVLTRANFQPDLVEHYFTQAAALVDKLKKLLPGLYGDFQTINTEPETEMAPSGPEQKVVWHYSRRQTEKLVRDIEQIFELRANSELEQPKIESQRRVFISHGQSDEWRKVQPFIEKDVKLQTIELAQEPNAGRTIIEKLIDNSIRCDSAVIVMTGDDFTKEEEARVRENVMHEIGFFQGSYGRKKVILLHEEGVNIPSNLSGVAYIPFPKDNIEAGFHVLQRELKAIYNL
ncbi:TIR domain-containing protein [Desulfuromonas sp. TF]|uniref:TIR domain-containing protein n=1 Tax=Desulfuromonas sp. TF TaxID=1232410 RepID=UPI0004891F57|nr:nucleotide-binding protein [Desulfuromonas sp. TF]